MDDPDRQKRMGQFSSYSDVAILWIEGYPAPEISERLDIAEGTVKSRLRKIRERVRVYSDDASTEKAEVFIATFV